MVMSHTSTSAIAKELQVPVRELFQRLTDMGYISRVNDTWILTDLGKDAGGKLKSHPQYGEYIAWDDNMREQLKADMSESDALVNVTAMSKHFQLSRNRMNPILSELGLIEKSTKGWVVTKLGEALGGKQFEYVRTGIPYVCWDESILKNKRLIETVQSVQGLSISVGKDEELTESVATSSGFREKFEAKLRTADGHYVRSRAEMLIDNWLYMSEIVHAYERRLPIEEELYCDFYLPVGKVYIEFWGMENDEKYNERKKTKIEIYNKYGFKLIEINDSDIQNLDDVLPKKLLKFGIQTY
jgi:hypothetical protein